MIAERFRTVTTMLLAASALTSICIVAAAQESDDNRGVSGPLQSGSVALDRRDVQVAQATEQTRTYAIPAGPLGPALNRFADESGLQLVYRAEIANGLRTNGVQGAYAPEQALQRLLAGSGITYRFTGPDAVTLARQLAQQNGDPQPLDPIVVEGERGDDGRPDDGYLPTRSATGTRTDTPLIEIPQSISVITQDRLDAFDVSTLNQALRYTPGVIGETFGNDSRVDFLQYRGFEEGGTGVFVDGLQLRSSSFAEFRPELYGAEQVDVLRGPSSVLYGQGTPGGLVNIVSKRPTVEPFGEVEVLGGTFDRFEGRFDLGGPVFESDSLFFRLTGLARSSETQVDFVDDDRIFIAPALTWQPRDDTTLTILSSFQDDETGSTNQFLPAAGTVTSNANGFIPTSRFAGEPDFDFFERTTFSLGYIFEHEFSDVWTIEQSARFDRLDVDLETVFGGGLAADQRTLNRFAFTVETDSNLFSVNNQAQADFTTGPMSHTVLFGVDYQRYDFDETQRFGSAPSLDIFEPVYGADVPLPPVTTDANIVQNQVGLFAQEQLTLYDNLVFTFGGRQDFVFSDRENRLAATTTEQDDSEFSWRAGVVYLFDNGIAPYAGYSESFLPIVGTNANGEPFEPETAEQYEVGIRYIPPGSDISLNLSAFHLTRENVRTPDELNPLNQVQTGEVRSQGIELEAIASFDFGLNVIAGYTFQDVEITESNAGDEGNRPVTVPEQLASIWADYTIQDGPLTGLGFGAGVRYNGETFGNADNTLEVNDFVLVDAALRYDWQNVSVAINAENLLDNTYVASCNSVNSCFFGTDRTITARLSYRF